MNNNFKKLPTKRHVLPDIAGHVELSGDSIIIGYSSAVAFKSRFHWFEVMLTIVVQAVRQIQNLQKVSC